MTTRKSTSLYGSATPLPMLPASNRARASGACATTSATRSTNSSRRFASVMRSPCRCPVTPVSPDHGVEFNDIEHNLVRELEALRTRHPAAMPGHFPVHGRPDHGLTGPAEHMTTDRRCLRLPLAVEPLALPRPRRRRGARENRAVPHLEHD